MNLFRTPSLPPDTIHFAALALLPFLLAGLHVFWAANLFGSAYWGGVGAPDPGETVARLRRSLFSGSAISLILLLITAARACWVTWRTRREE